MAKLKVSRGAGGKGRKRLLRSRSAKDPYVDATAATTTNNNDDPPTPPAKEEVIGTCVKETHLESEAKVINELIKQAGGGSQLSTLVERCEHHDRLADCRASQTCAPLKPL